MSQSSNSTIIRYRVIDSHTGGEPTRVVVEGGPDLGTGTMAERLALLRSRHDWLRTSLLNEPRGSDVMVGAVLCEPADSRCAAGVIFFNNVSYLNMCGHGMIGAVATLAHLNRIGPGAHRIETPVGNVTATLHEDLRISIENVPSYRFRKSVELADVPGVGTVVGNVAWGGNWFFLVSEHTQTLRLAYVDALTDYCWAIRQALNARGITGQDGQEIDHIELIGPPRNATADATSFVLCPGKAYDRSPCGTGTSAKVACLAADGKLAEGDLWRQESIVGSIFEARYRRDGDKVIPTITGSAFINAETTIIIDPRDPYSCGISSSAT
jgi:4-hydroxyproline epimerase